MIGIKIIGFVGESGTGKSYRAIWVAKENQMDYIIDDGLLIHGNSILAGKSAKSEKTKIASVRRALFTDKEHAGAVKDSIKKHQVDSILILGTSTEMVDSIATTLDLPLPSKYIHIKDVATKNEIEQAKHIRITEGKHVIPVPTFEVKKQFSGYFIDSLRFLMRDKKSNQVSLVDKSIVRPSFSYLGKYKISDRVIIQLCQFESKKVPQIYKTSKIMVEYSSRGVIIWMDIILRYGSNMKEASKKLIDLVTESVETFTAVNVIQVNVNIKSLYLGNLK